MNKIKIIIIWLFIPLIVLVALIFLKIKHKEELQQKAVLALEIQKVMYHLMFDLREARENTILDVPADGQWHSHIVFDRAGQGALEYDIKNRELYRFNNGNALLIADDIDDMRIRRQKATPEILEVEIEAKKNVSLMSYLKIRIRQ